MAKSMATKAKKEPVNTEDRVVESVVTAADWADRNRRVVTLGTVALIALLFAGWAYLDYRSKISERAAVRLDEIRMTSASGAPPEQVRAELAEYIGQFGGTPFGNEARLYMAQMDLRANDFDSAIRNLEPAADLAMGTPVAFRAAEAIAAAHEMAGRPEEAIRWHERIAREAVFGFQREDAIGEQARIHARIGDLQRAESLYRQLLADEEPQAEDQASIWAVRVGEVEALQAAGGSVPPVPEMRTFDPEALTAPSTGRPSTESFDAAPSESGDEAGNPETDSGE
ncbi:MAG: tetratricopeptide repeat protein [marine benthic group bacterium]|jgi:predicted negative regulator of RcsB-dependent stress response|nr:tetratricopeptide repeat protein [Candidatus Carthagonibacter metallireducens]MCL7964402.1 tetratricopeptide repeat protein [Gemmatimonadota bacterium]MCL7979974.1 tetratricopeptide repeat protein [Gemmatimonadota bacterium]MCL7982331.1 tetratricopeptide repeat protein [Gemmatimonadota bacterium]MCL7984991.1 tetratricopeptide repeat protein [Gemmatimonadota bacterium]